MKTDFRFEHGLNGILADEMGLGKTLQTIAFLAFLREKQILGPFLISAPLSTIANWVNEFEKFAPTIPVVLYHGTPDERQEIRDDRLQKVDDKFPVVITSFELCMRDRIHLQRFQWKFIIVDEGHRIKNLNCRLVRELKSYDSANRLLLTGTPLQNNLAELWSLLSFLLPDIFSDFDSFQHWFDFSALKEKEGHKQILDEEEKSSLVSNLHAILKPFLLRRLKADVEHSLPLKREYVLYCPLTSEQQELYRKLLAHEGRDYLIKKIMSYEMPASGSRKRKGKPHSRDAKSAKLSSSSSPNIRRKGRAREGQYEELDDDEYFSKLENDSDESEEDPLDESEARVLRARMLLFPCIAYLCRKRSFR